MRQLKKFKIPDDACYDYLNSPVGCLTIIASKDGLHSILWDNDLTNEMNQTLLNNYQYLKNHTIIKKTKKQLIEYFNGKRKAFDLPIVLHGTSFQIQAWNELCKIPYGKTISYSEQAKQLGHTNKARAVGLANGVNPISIIVPCHRVIGTNGQLTGFGGGIDKKAFLLKLEKNKYIV